LAGYFPFISTGKYDLEAFEFRVREAVLTEDEAFNNERMDEVHFTLSAVEFEIECAQREVQRVMAMESFFTA
jgi:hypothetical protein